MFLSYPFTRIHNKCTGANVNKLKYTHINTQTLKYLPPPESLSVISSLSSCQLHAHLLCAAIRERLERYLKLSSLIISRIPQDTLCDVTEEGGRTEGGREGWKEGGTAGRRERK